MTEALQGVTKKWLSVLTRNGMLNELNGVLAALPKRVKHDMFKFARYSFTDVRYVVLGMYPDSGSNGLAFGSSHMCSSTLMCIYKHLIQQKLLAAVPETHDLEHLAAQGVLLLNLSLTTEHNKPGIHTNAWSSYMDKVLANLSHDLPAGTKWYMWGVDNKLHLVGSKHVVLRSCSPHQDAFVCDLSSMDVIWDPLLTETHFYTDCSARNNQHKSCRASSGVVCTRGLLQGRTWASEIHTAQVMFRGSMVEARPTNIRGEGAALIQALQLACILPTGTRIVIHSDSKFWIDDMLQTYIPAWVQQGCAFTQKKNADQVEEMWGLWMRVRAHCRLQFVNAWHDRARPATHPDLEWWLGNAAAEKAAEAVLGL